MTPATYVLVHDGEEPEAIELAAFIEINQFPLEIEAALRSLQPGETFSDGGGASPEWTVTRTA